MTEALRPKTIIGIVACGGESSRMGIDKSRINYHGTEQRYFVYDLLSNFCDDVYISVKNDPGIIDSTYKYICDIPEYSGHGPISALMTAFKFNPEKAILLVGCDYPLITENTIHKLTENINPAVDSICYMNSLHIPEPLLTLYSHSAGEKLKAWFNSGNYSLRKFLMNVKTDYIFPNDNIEIKSADTWYEYKEALIILNDITKKIKDVHLSS